MQHSLGPLLYSVMLTYCYPSWLLCGLASVWWVVKGKRTVCVCVCVCELSGQFTELLYRHCKSHWSSEDVRHLTLHKTKKTHSNWTRKGHQMTFIFFQHFGNYVQLQWPYVKRNARQRLCYAMSPRSLNNCIWYICTSSIRGHKIKHNSNKLKEKPTHSHQSLWCLQCVVVDHHDSWGDHL